MVQDAHSTRRQRLARAGRGGLSALLLVLGAATPLLAGPKPLAQLADGRCRAGAGQHPFKPELTASKRALTETNRLGIVALGSSSTAGTGASDPDRSYPAVLEAELRRRLPGREVKVTNLGVGGQSAYEMYLRLESEVIPERPALVIWQTAVNDAIRDIGEEKLAKILRKGALKLQEAGIDLVLMDMPWLMREGRYPKYDDYRAVLAKVASESGVPLFPRYAMMKSWSGSKQFSEDEIVGMSGLQVVEAGYRCFGLRLADGIVGELGERGAPGKPTN